MYVFTDVVTENELIQIKVILSNYAPEWKKIGQGVGFTDRELTVIEHAPLNLFKAPVSWLNQMLDDWQKRKADDSRGKPTRAALVSAVDKAGLGRIAEEIRDMKV